MWYLWQAKHRCTGLQYPAGAYLVRYVWVVNLQGVAYGNAISVASPVVPLDLQQRAGEYGPSKA